MSDVVVSMEQARRLSLQAERPVKQSHLLLHAVGCRSRGAWLASLFLRLGTVRIRTARIVTVHHPTYVHSVCAELCGRHSTTTFRQTSPAAVSHSNQGIGESETRHCGLPIDEAFGLQWPGPGRRRGCIIAGSAYVGCIPTTRIVPPDPLPIVLAPPPAFCPARRRPRTREWSGSGSGSRVSGSRDGLRVSIVVDESLDGNTSK